VLFRDDPQLYTNRHIEDDWQGDLRRHDNLPLHGVISYGVEGLAESIDSTNLGIHERKRASGYAFYDLRSVRRYSFSVGIREEVYGSRSVDTSPTVSGGAWISSKFKLRASASRAFRLPSFTDLYYSDPSDLGNPNLKPESATSYEAGLDGYLRKGLHASVTAFQRRDQNVIDYVAPPGSTVYTAENFDNFHFTGVETGIAWDPGSTQHFAVAFSGLRGLNVSPEVGQAKYTFNYPLESAVIEWRGMLAKKVIARTRIGVENRLDYAPYAIWDASASYATGRVRPFLQLTNITSTVYQDLPGIAMPKRGVVGGCEFYLYGGK
jgi:iron complex outermembrane receptor protein